MECGGRDQLHFILPFFLQNEVSILNEDDAGCVQHPAGAETLNTWRTYRKR